MLKQTAELEEQTEGTDNLEHEIVEALQPDGDISSVELQALLDRTSQAILDADAKAIIAKEQAYDPSACPDPSAARQMLEDAIFRANRLLTLKPRLQLRLEKAAAAETQREWAANYRRVTAKVEAVAELWKKYREHVAAILEMIRESQAVQVEIDAVNRSAGAGEPRRVLPPEQITRGITDFSIAVSTPSVAANLKLPDFDYPAQYIFPPPQRIDPSLYAPIPFNPRFSPEWFTVVEAEQKKQQERAARELEEAERGCKEFYGRRVAE